MASCQQKPITCRLFDYRHLTYTLKFLHVPGSSRSKRLQYLLWKTQTQVCTYFILFQVSNAVPNTADWPLQKSLHSQCVVLQAPNPPLDHPYPNPSSLEISFPFGTCSTFIVTLSWSPASEHNVVFCTSSFFRPDTIAARQHLGKSARTLSKPSGVDRLRQSVGTQERSIADKVVEHRSVIPRNSKATQMSTVAWVPETYPVGLVCAGILPSTNIF